MLQPCKPCRPCQAHTYMGTTCKPSSDNYKVPHTGRRFQARTLTCAALQASLTHL